MLIVRRVSRTNFECQLRLDDVVKTAVACTGVQVFLVFLKTQRWMSPNITMSRLREKGAKLKVNNVFSSDVQISRKNV